MNNEDLQGVLEAAGLAFWEYDPTTDQVSWGSALSDLLGQPAPKAKVSLDEWLGTVHADDIASARAAMESALHHRDRPFTADFRAQHANGDWRWLQVSGRVVENKSGKHCRVIGTATDITTLRVTQAMLREREETLSAIIDQINDGIVLIDTETFRFLEFNEAAHNGLGYTREEFSSIGLPEIQGEMNRQQIAERMQGLIRAGRGDFETVHRRKDGSLRGIHVRNRPIELRGRRYQVSIWRDTAQAKQLEDALRQSEANLKRAQAVSRTGSWRLDIPTGRVDGSDEAYRIFGLAPGTPLKLTDMLSFIHHDDRELVAASWREGVARGWFDVENRILVGNKVRWVRQRAEINVSQDGVPITGFGTVQDITERKVVENALRKSEERFARAFLSNPAALSILREADGIVIDINAACLALFGLTRRDVIGRTIDELDVFMEGSDVRQRWTSGGGQRRWETVIQSKNGQHRHVELSAESVELDDEPCSLLMLVDITERKRAEAALRESQKVLAEAQTIGKMGSWTADLTTRYFNLGEEGARLIGLLPGLCSREQFMAMIPPVDRARVEDQWQCALLTDSAYDIEHRVLVHNEVRWVHVRATIERDEKGRPVRAIGMTQDVTESRNIRETLEQYQTHLEDIVVARTGELQEANRRLQVSDQRLNALFALSQRASEMSERELLQAGIDEAERLTGSDLGYLHLLGSDEQTIALATWSSSTLRHCRAVTEMHHPVLSAGIWADTARRRMAISHNDSEFLAQHHHYPQGHPELFRHLGVPVFEDGRMVMLLGVGNKTADYDDSDVHELQLIGNDLWRIIMRRRTEIALAEAKRAAEAANYAKGIFLANMSHEIRTPLNAVLGLAQIGQRQSAGRKTGELFERIIDSGQHLLGIIDDILDFSKIEAGKLTLEHSVVRLGDVIDRAVEFTANRAFIKGLDFQVSEGPDLPATFCGDPLRLSQVLVNLLGNAIKFTNQGLVTLSVQAQDGYLLFSVTDSGIGMTADQVERLFSPFEQADGSTTRRFGGTGLGLAISKHLVNLMGGTISVECQVGYGCRFVVQLPLMEATQPSPADGRVVLYALPTAEALRLAVPLQMAGIQTFRVAADEPLPAGADLIVTSSEALCQERQESVLRAAIERGQRLGVMHTPGADAIPSAVRDHCIRLERPLRVRHIISALSVPSARTDEEAGRKGRLKDVKILVAEDNEVNRLVLEEMLGMEGAHLVCVENGQLAVEEIRRKGAKAYDLVLTDIQMPLMDGYEATRQIQVLAPQLPVIGLTAHAMPEEKARCLAAGMVGHLAKPFELSRLVALIQAWVAAPVPPPSSPAPAPSAAPMPSPNHPINGLIDRAALSARYRHRDAFITRLMSAVSTNNRDVPTALRQAAQSNDMESLVRLAHSLKGTAGNILAETVHDLAFRTETAARRQAAEALNLALELAATTERLLHEIALCWPNAASGGATNE